MKQNMLDTYTVLPVSEYLVGNPYVGRGIIIGVTPSGDKAVTAYFIMGRSENSRNRVFIREGSDLLIKPFDESKVEDPSLIIYYPLRTIGSNIVVTNGDQTDTIMDYLTEGKTFCEALYTREFEPDAPNYTPRISGIYDMDNMTYSLSIIKAGDPEGSSCSRYFFDYESQPALGHFLHTYETDGEPIPIFVGEPERIEMTDDIDAFTEDIWSSLDEDNKISLYVRYTDTDSRKYFDRLINKYE